MRIRYGTATVKGALLHFCHWACTWEDGEGEELESGYFCHSGNKLNELLSWFQHGEVFALEERDAREQNIRKLVLKLELGIDIKRVREYLLMAQSQMLADKRYSSLQIYYDVDPL